MVPAAAMHAPYTDQPADAFQTAQIATAALLTLVGYRPLVARGRALFALWVGAVWLAALAPMLAAAGPDLGFRLPLRELLWASSGLLLLALPLSGRWTTLFALPFAALLVVAGENLTDFERERCAGQLILTGIVLGLAAPRWRRPGPVPDPPSPALIGPSRRREYAQDVFFILIGTLAAALVSTFVLFRSGDGSDESAYTYQAAVYAKGHLYGKTPVCMNALRNFWVFWRDDRMFAQYQPGWPLFLVPFVWIRAIWLGGPVSFGLLCMAVARLARRAVKYLPGSSGSNAPLRAGMVAGIATLCANTLLINGGSRFPHVFVATLFALSVETAWVLGRTRDRRRAAFLGVKLGSFAGWMLLVRAPDAVLLASGPLLYLLLAVIRRRSHWFGLATGVLASIPWAGFLLWSAHVQVGGWGVMPYQLLSEFYPWATVTFSLPLAHQWKWSIPIGVGAYCWWPLSPALGLGGLFLACRERQTRAVAFTLVCSIVPVLLFYGLLELGRGGDFGYGPRYVMVSIVPTAVGTALLVERSIGTASRALRAVVLAGLLVIAGVGFVVLGSQLFPPAYKLLHTVSGPERAATRARLKRAIVLVPNGVTPYGPHDVTRNVPIEMYEPSVIYANETDTACLRREYPNRTIYRATGRGDVTLTPLAP